MNPSPTTADGRLDFARFLAGGTDVRLFEWPTAHPSQPTGFCPCDGAWVARLWFYLKAGLLLRALKAPFNRPKLWLLRRAGAAIGERVYLSADVWIDPVFPQLLTIEDEVMLGVGVRIALHEFGRDRFRAGRVTLRRGALIGGFALIGPGVEVGAHAVVAGGAVVGRDVPAGMLAIGNPARVLPLHPTPTGGEARGREAPGGPPP